MKTQTKIKTVLAVMALSATALIASAQDDGQNGPPPGGGPDQGGGPGQGGGGFGGGPRHHRPFPAIIRALDVNHDGLIDSNEIANASAELLTLDKNHAGQLTFDEYMGRPPGRPLGDGEGPGGPTGGNDGNAGGPPDGPPPGASDENTNTPPSGGDQGGPGGPGFGGHRQHPPLPAIIRALDLNHDGIIDSNEIANASAELLTLDKNHDGQLTRDEYLGRPPGHRGGGDGGPGGEGDGNGPGGPPPGEGNEGPPGAGNDGPSGAPPDGNGPPPMQQ
jgi:hypothetical protein